MEIAIILKLIFSLAVVVGLIFIISYILRTYTLKFPYQGKAEDIRIRDIKFISKDKGFTTIEFDNKIFLIGFDNNYLSVIYTKNTDKEEKDG